MVSKLRLVREGIVVVGVNCAENAVLYPLVGLLFAFAGWDALGMI